MSVASPHGLPTPCLSVLGSPAPVKEFSTGKRGRSFPLPMYTWLRERVSRNLRPRHAPPACGKGLRVLG